MNNNDDISGASHSWHTEAQTVGSTNVLTGDVAHVILRIYQTPSLILCMQNQLGLLYKWE